MLIEVRLRRPKSEPGCVPDQVLGVGVGRRQPCALGGAYDSRDGDWEGTPR